jgi:hypothetical protein
MNLQEHNLLKEKMVYILLCLCLKDLLKILQQEGQLLLLMVVLSLVQLAISLDLQITMHHLLSIIHHQDILHL